MRMPGGSTIIGSAWPKSTLLTFGRPGGPYSSRTVRHGVSA